MGRVAPWIWLKIYPFYYTIKAPLARHCKSIDLANIFYMKWLLIRDRTTTGQFYWYVTLSLRSKLFIRQSPKITWSPCHVTQIRRHFKSWVGRVKTEHRKCWWILPYSCNHYPMANKQFFNRLSWGESAPGVMIWQAAVKDKKKMYDSDLVEYLRTG